MSRVACAKAQILLQLAASCERESPSREIDCHIAFFVTGDLQVGVKGPLKAPLPYMLSEAVERPRDLQLLANDDNIDMIPRYTTSLDAAVTLELPGFFVTVVAGKGQPCAVGWLDAESGVQFNAEAPTEPMARCAAALRARAATQAPEEGE